MRQVMVKSGFSNEETMFLKLVRKYLPYWPWFLFSGFLFVSLGLIYIRYATPMYEATASLIIKDEKKGSEESKFLESLNIVASKKIIENEVEVLKSRRVADSVVERMHLYAPVFVKGKVNDISAYDVSPIWIEAVDSDSLTNYNKAYYFTVNTHKHTVGLSDGSVFPVGKEVSTAFGRVKFMPTKFYYKKHHSPLYFKLLEKKAVANDILKRLKVTATNKLSSVIELKYRDALPSLSEDILDHIISSYNSILMHEKDALAKNTMAFIESRLSVVSSDLDQIEQQIQQYKGNSGAVDIGTQGQLFLQNVSANDQRLTELTMQLSVIDQIFDQLNNGNNIALLPASLGLNDPALSQLMNSLNNYQLEREKLKKTVAENNPMFVSVTDQIEETKKRIAENLSTFRRSIEAGKANIQETNRSYNGILHNIPQKEKELLSISRDQSIKSGIYSFLLQKREETELMHASKINENRLVNYAQSSDEPVSPNKLILLSSCLFAIFAFPIGLISARELLNTTVLFRSDIEAELPFEVIGEIAYNNSGNHVLIQEGKRSYAAEEFRKIRYSIQHFSKANSVKRILVTSSISGEGKSFVAANLAISYSVSGKKVLLLDFDLHQSRLAERFGFKDVPGMTDYFLGSSNLKDIINPVKEISGLYFITSGSVFSNPSELIDEKKIQQLLDQLEPDFDIIVIDTAPAVPVTDAYLLSSACDATLYIIRHGYTPKSLLKKFQIIHNATPLSHALVIFNGVKTRGYLKSNYGYGYGYAYIDAYENISRENKRVSIAN